MSKLRVTDLAGEFGISADEVIGLLRQMDIPVRSHVTPLADDQVARVRARWEREKRARTAAPAQPAGSRRRRSTAAAQPEPAPAPAEPAAGVRRRRAVEQPPEPERDEVAEAPVGEARARVGRVRFSATCPASITLRVMRKCTPLGARSPSPKQSRPRQSLPCPPSR